MVYNLDLTVAWAFLLAFAVFAYVVMDGFDLGIGILFPTIAVGPERDSAMNSIAPVWDGNETWLVLGGGGLFAAFPLAYAIILPAVYPPLIVMLLGLVFRGVAFEYRWRDTRHRGFWDWAFSVGSFAAAFSQGVILGAVLQGITVSGRAYGGGWLDWLSPFSVLTGVSTVAAYALLGATWLIWRTEGPAQAHARRLSWWAFGATLLAIGAVSLMTLTLKTDYFSKWFGYPQVLATALVPIATGAIALGMVRSLRHDGEGRPFLLALALFALTFAGLGVSLFPWIVPEALTIWDAAAPESSQIFMGVGALVMMPIILAYTAYAYWVFRGKTGHEGYH